MSPILITLDYSLEKGLIILMTDISLDGWGIMLIQLRNRKWLPSQYESGIWNCAKMKYDIIKREYKGVLFALKRLYYYLYSTYFLLEIDTKVLMYQLNRLIINLPDVLFSCQVV